MQQEISIQLVCHDATHYPTDVLALKYAQANYGLDKVVTQVLSQGGRQVSLMRPKPGDSKLIEGVPDIAAKFILFVGVASLSEFGYQEIREFSRTIFSALAAAAPRIETVALTLHGVGYGLDEFEAFESELAGIQDAIQDLDVPPSLREVAILERDFRRVKRLQQLMDDLFPGGKIVAGKKSDRGQALDTTERLRSVGYTSDSKAHVFVAMPFREEMDDIYHYGIQGAVKAAGYLCERADLSAFTGDVMEWVRNRIKSSQCVVADLTGANPNVYLEVGYAWGCGIPTILLVNDPDHLKFDVRGQRCLTYKKIQDLEESLRKELDHLKTKGVL